MTHSQAQLLTTTLSMCGIFGELKLFFKFSHDVPHVPRQFPASMCMLILFLFLSLLRAPSDPLAVVSHLLSLSSSPSQLPLLIRAAESSRIPLDSLLSFAPNIQYTPNTNSSTESTFRSSLTTLLLDNGVRPSPLDAGE